MANEVLVRRSLGVDQSAPPTPFTLLDGPTLGIHDVVPARLNVGMRFGGVEAATQLLGERVTSAALRAERGPGVRRLHVLLHRAGRTAVHVSMELGRRWTGIGGLGVLAARAAANQSEAAQLVVPMMNDLLAERAAEVVRLADAEFNHLRSLPPRRQVYRLIDHLLAAAVDEDHRRELEHLRRLLRTGALARMHSPRGALPTVNPHVLFTAFRVFQQTCRS